LGQAAPEDLPNGDSRGRAAGCSLMSMPRTHPMVIED